MVFSLLVILGTLLLTVGAPFKRLELGGPTESGETASASTGSKKNESPGGMQLRFGKTDESAGLPDGLTLVLRIEPPAYTSLASTEVTELESLEVPQDSQLSITLTAPKNQLKEVTLEQKALSTVTRQFRVTETGNFSASLRAEESGEYSITATDKAGKSVSLTKLHITVLPDAKPQFEFKKPSPTLQPNPGDEVTFMVEVSDDYGVDDIILNFLVEGKRPQKRKISTDELESQDPKLKKYAVTVFLSELGVEAGDSLNYYCSARDNRQPRGQEAVSDTASLKISR